MTAKRVGETRIHAPRSSTCGSSEIAEPRPGDMLDVGGEAFVIPGGPVRDAERLVWTLEACPV